MVQLFKKYQHVFVLLYFIPYSILYFVIGRFREPVIYVHSFIDDLIPFNEFFVIPYVLWYVYVACTLIYLMFKSKDDFLNMCFFTFMGTTICLIIYAIIPNGITFRPETIEGNYFVPLIEALFSADKPTNVCPSIHCFVSMTTHCMFVKSSALNRSKILTVASFIMALLICASTVFLKQHSIIDGFFALILATILYYFTFHTNWRKLFSKKYHLA